MDPLQAAVAEFQKTIADLSIRLANMASVLADTENKLKVLTEKKPDGKNDET